jgi:3,4-dihydroxy-2-butanone 4-phosphate synthase
MRDKQEKSWNTFLTPAEDDKELELLYKNIVGDTSVPQSHEEKPHFIQAAESRAKSTGISANQLLATYSERLRNSKYPTPECLTPGEIEAGIQGASLAPERRKHIESCEGCKALLEAAEPPENVLVELAEEVRLMTARFCGHARAATAGGTERSRPKILKATSSLFR